MSKEQKAAWQREDRKKNPEKYKKAQARWRNKNKERLLKYQRDHYRTPTGKSSRKAANLKCQFGLSLQAYLTLLEAQEHRCAICQQEETVKRRGVVIGLSVDHCHKTGRVRGLLCRACNVLLGNSRENILVLAAAIQYLQTHTVSR